MPLFGDLFSKPCQPSVADLETLRQTVSRLESQVATLRDGLPCKQYKSKMDALAAEIDELRQTVKQLQDRIANLEENVTLANERFTGAAAAFMQ
jgi:cell division protein FtsB